MQSYITNLTKTGKTTKYAFMFIGTLGIIILIAGILMNFHTLMLIGMFLSLTSTGIGVFYFEYFRPFFSSIKNIEKYYDTSIFNDIKPNTFSFPKSQICCGEKAFFSKKSRVIIPYSAVVWVYIQNTKALGITVDQQVMVNCRDGKCFSIIANKEELNILLSIIQKHSPDLMLGYGHEQMRKAYEISKQFKVSKKKEYNNDL